MGYFVRDLGVENGEFQELIRCFTLCGAWSGCRVENEEPASALTLLSRSLESDIVTDVGERPLNEQFSSIPT